MDFLRQFMAGRRGLDQLGLFLLAVYLLLALLNRMLKSPLLALLALAALALSVFRLLSRRLDRRQAENERFLRLVRPILNRYNVSRQRYSDKEHRYFKCPNCGQQLRVPRGKGRISITCRSCGVSFEEKT